MNTKRHIQPLYDLGACSKELVESVKCGFARQVYARFLKARYGVNSCVEDLYEKFLVKKELLELNMIFDPAYCTFPLCIEPCGVSVVITGYDVKVCPAPTGPAMTVSVPEIECNAPQGASMIINYQS